jgi:hypothetical protein
MIVGVETKVKKVKAEGTTPQAPTRVAQKVNACIKEKGQEKGTKVDRKVKAKQIGLPWANAPRTLAVTATNLDTKIVIAENGNTMKNKRLKQTMANT